MSHLVSGCGVYRRRLAAPACVDQATARPSRERGKVHPLGSVSEGWGAPFRTVALHHTGRQELILHSQHAIII